MKYSLLIMVGLSIAFSVVGYFTVWPVYTRGEKLLFNTVVKRSFHNDLRLSTNKIVNVAIDKGILSIEDVLENPKKYLGYWVGEVDFYATKLLLNQGEKPVFMLGSELGRNKTYVVNGVRIFNSKNELVFSEELNLKVSYSPCESYRAGGCNYKVKYVLNNKLEKGIYKIQFLLRDGEPTNFSFFAIRNPESAATSAVIFPDLTWQAYNHFGGASLYGIRYSLVEPISLWKSVIYFLYERDVIRGLPFDLKPIGVSRSYRRPRFSFVNDQRPISQWRRNFGVGKSIYKGMAGVIHLEELLNENFNDEIKYFSDTFLDQYPDSLDRIRTLYLIGHQEYWTENTRVAVDRFIKRGGNVVNFSGNIAWHQLIKVGSEWVKNENSANQRQEDSRYAKAGLYAFHVSPMPQESFCLSYEFGGYPIKEYVTKKMMLDEAYGISQSKYDSSSHIYPLIPGHPILKNTRLGAGKEWRIDGLLGVELDGILLDDQLNVDLRYAEFFPDSIEVLAWAHSYIANRIDRNGHRHMRGSKIGILAKCKPFQGGGTVISFGSIGVINQLRSNVEVQRLLINTVNYLEN